MGEMDRTLEAVNMGEVERSVGADSLLQCWILQGNSQSDSALSNPFTTVCRDVLFGYILLASDSSSCSKRQNSLSVMHSGRN